jgi:hypothetical protein
MFIPGMMTARDLGDSLHGLADFCAQVDLNMRLMAATVKTEWIPWLARAAETLAEWANSLARIPHLPTSLVEGLTSFAAGAVTASRNIDAIGRQMGMAQVHTSEFRLELERLRGSLGAVEQGSVEAVSAILEAQNMQRGGVHPGSGIILASSTVFDGPPEPAPGAGPGGPGVLTNPALLAPAIAELGIVGGTLGGGAGGQGEVPAAIDNQTNTLMGQLREIAAALNNNQARVVRGLLGL